MILVEPIRNNKWIKDGAYLLAIQYYAIKKLKLDDTIVFPYICDPHVQIGYFQNPLVEVNYEYLQKNNFSIVRRDTGGGAIYIDNLSANFCFSFPYKKHKELLGNYNLFYKPILQILNSMNVNAVYSGKNDLVLENKKISGAAMSLVDDRIYAGFSLLWDIDFGVIDSVLTPSAKKMEAKGIKSVKQRLNRIKDYLPQYRSFDSFQFKDLILEKFLEYENQKKYEKFILTDDMWNEIDDLVNLKYKNDDWTYGLTPSYSYNVEQRLDFGTINFSLEIIQHKINKIKITGDFFIKKPLEEFESKFIGLFLDKKSLLEALKNVNLFDFFNTQLNIENIIEILIQ